MRAAHALADLFPMMSAAERERLKGDILENALNENIVVLDGLILDGRNRASVLAEIGFTDEQLADVEIAFEDTAWAQHRAEKGIDLDPLGFVLSKNLHRRHLTESQRALVAGRIATMRQGARTDLPDEPAILQVATGDVAGEPSANLPKVETGVSTAEAADRLAVSQRSVTAGRAVAEHGAPELQQAVERGEASISAAAELATLPKEDQTKIVLNLARDAETGELTKESQREISRFAKELRDKRTAEKKELRAERERALGAKLLTAPEGRFGVVLEDYEWDHETWSEAGKDRHASNHYPTSAAAHTAEEIAERTRARFACAADDCVLAMWTPAPHLAIALDVMRLRGFAYKSNFAWDKGVAGTGYWNRNRHEILLIGTRGNVPAPAMGTQFDSLLPGARGAHSAKPEWQHELLEAYFPSLPKIELNARRARPGWTAWGLEAPAADAPETPPHDPETGEITEEVTSPAIAFLPTKDQPQPIAAAPEDDLEIPPFLRRKA